MTRILGLSGSLRKGPFNTALLRAAAALVPAGASLDVVTLHGIPLYDGDAEARDGIPAAVTALKQRIVDSDALLIATPGYNNGMPGVLKNGIDWLSRPAASRHRPGLRPTACRHHRGLARGLRHDPGAERLAAGVAHAGCATLVRRPADGVGAGQVFDEGGAMVDEKMKAQLQQFLQGFVTAIERPAP